MITSGRIRLDLTPEEAFDVIYRRTGRIYFIDPCSNVFLHDPRKTEAVQDIDLEIYETDDNDRVKYVRHQLENAEQIFAVMKEKSQYD